MIFARVRVRATILIYIGISWLFFSKKDLKNHGIDYCRLHPKTIYIAIDDKKLEKIKEFIPQDKVIREYKSKWLQ